MTNLRRGAWRLAAGALVLLAGLAAAGAAEINDPAPGLAGVTYFDLVKLLIPDLAPVGRGGASGSLLLPRRGLETAAPRSQNLVIAAPRAILPLDLPASGKQLALIVELAPAQGPDDTTAILMLVDLQRDLHLLDAIQLNDETTPAPKIAVAGELAERAPLLEFTSERAFAGGRIAATELAFIRDGHFAPLAQFSTLSEAGCGFRRSQSADIKLTGTASPYRAAQVRIVDRIAAAEGCKDKPKLRPGDKTYVTTYAWSRAAQRFTPSNSDMALLERDNRR